MFFEKLTNMNLQVLCFNRIKHNLHRSYAVDVITMSTNMDVFCKNLLFEKTKNKFVFLNKTDRIGLQITFVLQKQSGFIKLYLRKKRSAEINVVFSDSVYHNVKQKFHFKHDCEELWVKSILFEYEDYILSYLRNNCSNKLNNLLCLISLLSKDVTTHLSVHIDIPGHIVII